MSKNFHIMLPRQKEKLRLIVNGKSYPLQQHNESSLKQAQRSNRALTMMSKDKLLELNYFVSIDEKNLAQDHLSRLQIVSDDNKEGFKLPKLHYFSYYIPEKCRKVYYQNKLKQSGNFKHAHYNLLGLKQNNLLGATLNETAMLFADMDEVLSPMDIAKSIIFQHPNLANTQPYTATIIMNDHIAPSPEEDLEQYNRLYKFAMDIKAQGADAWCQRTYSVNPSTKEPLVYEYDVLGHKAGEKVEIYNLSTNTLSASKDALSGALGTASEDTKLNGTSWHLMYGMPAETTEQEAYKVEQMKDQELRGLEKESSNIKWTLKEGTALPGLYYDKKTLKYNKDTFSIDVRNVHLRTLCTYVQFLDDSGKPLPNSGKKFVKTIGPTETVMGIPTPYNKSTVEFGFPAEANSAKLMFGSLGTSKWDTEVDIKGAVLTAIFQLGIPTLYLTADAMLASNKFFTDCEEDAEYAREIVEKYLEMIEIVSQELTPIEIAEEFMKLIATSIAGFIVEKVMTRVLAYITATIMAEEVANAIPFVGQALQVAAVLADVAQITQTTAEILASPATMALTVTRSMGLEVKVHPDPKHGEKGRPETATWPTVGTKYKIIVTYKGGTTFVNEGKLPEGNNPIVVNFLDVPVGGSFKISTYIYSETNWLCGVWESKWEKALLNDREVLKLVEGNIEEILVPLTSEVQYNYYKKAIYNAESKKYQWTQEDRPTDTITVLAKKGEGNSLCDIVNMTYSSTMKQIGYVWSASGENLPPIQSGEAVQIEYLMQNLSTLADGTGGGVDSLNERYKTSEIGFIKQPNIAYDKFGDSDNNFILDTRNNMCHLRKVNLTDGEHGFGLDKEDLQSWGRFNQSYIDAFVIHPKGFAIGVNWENSKMEVLELPTEGYTDEEAPIAQLVSGEGFAESRLYGPSTLKIAPDGSVLVLETKNRRIQSFDIYGNAIPNFKGEYLFSAKASEYAEILSNQSVTEELQGLFNLNDVDLIFEMSSSYIATLDEAVMTEELGKEFTAAGVYLCLDNILDAETGEEKPATYIDVKVKGERWQVIDAAQGNTYEIVLKQSEDRLGVNRSWEDGEIKVVENNKVWTISNKARNAAYMACIEDDEPSQIRFYRYRSYMNLYGDDKVSNSVFDTYLDFSVEAKGYIYVLMYQNDGSQETDYYLDIYNPDGTFLVRTPDSNIDPTNTQHITAAKIEIDEFRTLHTLNFEKMVGKQGFVEPTISQWNPTTPSDDK